jgi:hypothetical protein
MTAAHANNVHCQNRERSEDEAMSMTMERTRRHQVWTQGGLLVTHRREAEIIEERYGGAVLPLSGEA